MDRLKQVFFQLILLVGASLLAVLVSNYQTSVKGESKENTVIGQSAFMDRITAELPVFGEKVEIILTGDVMLGRTVMTKSMDLGDFSYPFRKVGSKLREADIVFINLENPIIEDCPLHYIGLKFCASPEMVEGLIFSGVDVINVANNHTLNYGREGLTETASTLEEHGFLVTGLDNLIIKEVKGIKFGFMGFDFVSSPPTEEDFHLVKSSSGNVDVLIIGVHWGSEYMSQPTNVQREQATRLVESGADVIVGHHPHWVQETDIINGRPVYYSLGNFVFDQMWSKKTREGLLVKLTFGGKQLVEEKLPTYISSWAQPEFLKN